MKKYALLISFFAAFLSLSACKQPPHPGDVLINAASTAPLEAGRPATVTVSLADARTGAPLGEEDLKVVHTQRFHALVVDETLDDYQHLHPKPTANKGEYTFTFTPKNSGDYRVWADVTPVATDRQTFAVADLKGAERAAGHIEKKRAYTASAGGITLDLLFDTPPKEGEPIMGTVIISRNGNPFTKLQPVMGAFIHIVGFAEDGARVIHVHEMGEPPAPGATHAPSDIAFHIEPQKEGFLKLFMQVRADNRDIFAPFGIMVGKK